MRFARPTIERGTRLVRTANRCHTQLVRLETDVRTLATPLLISSSLRVLRGYGRALTRQVIGQEAPQTGPAALHLNNALARLNEQLRDTAGKPLGGQALVALQYETAIAFLDAYTAVDQLRGAVRRTVSV